MPPKDKTVDLPLTDSLENWNHDRLVNYQNDNAPNIPDKFDDDDEYSWEDFLLDNADSYDDFFLKD